MNNLSTFDFKNHPVRVLSHDPFNPQFVANDVVNALGYKDRSNAIKQHCRGVVKHHPIIDKLNRTQDVRVINEPDLYRLIFGSKLESAMAFQDWVFEDVLPQIRKTGGFQTKSIQEEQAGTAFTVSGVDHLALQSKYIELLEEQKRKAEAQKPKRRQPKKLSFDEIEQIHRLREQGYSIKAVAEKLNRAKATVSYTLRGCR